MCIFPFPQWIHKARGLYHFHLLAILHQTAAQDMFSSLSDVTSSSQNQITMVRYLVTEITSIKDSVKWSLKLFCTSSQRSCRRGILDYPSSVRPSVRWYALNKFWTLGWNLIILFMTMGTL